MLKIFILFLAILMTPLAAYAAVVEWDRNSEPDMKDYQVYGCFTANCVLIKSSSTFLPGATVLQTASGVKPTFTIDLANKEGVIGVVARDLTLNESTLGAVNFDKVAPIQPAGLTVR